MKSLWLSIDKATFPGMKPGRLGRGFHLHNSIFAGHLRSREYDGQRIPLEIRLPRPS